MPNLVISDLTVNGVRLPTPANKGVTISHNKVWSANTGRDSSGAMVGTLLSIKTKLEVKWPPLSMTQFALIQEAVSADFAPVTFTDSSGATVTKTMYFGDLTGNQFSWADGIQYVTDVGVSMIER